MTKPLTAAVTAGLGAGVTLGLRLLLPDPSHLDAFGQAPPSASSSLQFTFGALALGAFLGLTPLLPWRRMLATFFAAIVGGVLSWLLVMRVAIDQSAASMTTGDAITAGIIMSPVLVAFAAFGLVGLLAYCTVLSLALNAIGSRLAQGARVLQLGLLTIWVGDAALVVVALPTGVDPPPRPATIAVAEPPLPACTVPPFADTLNEIGLRASIRRELPDEHAVEFTVIGPSGWTESDAINAATGVLTRASPCLEGGVRWTARAVPGASVPITVHFKAKVPPGTDRINFELMLASQLRDVFDGHLHLTPEGTMATTIKDVWAVLPKSVMHELSCEPARDDLRCSTDSIELTTPGASPRFFGVKVEYLKR